MDLPLPKGFWLRGTKLRPWSKQNSDQNSDHARLCISQGKEKLRPWSQFPGRENSDHGLNLCLPRGGGRSCLDDECGLKSDSLGCRNADHLEPPEARKSQCDSKVTRKVSPIVTPKVTFCPKSDFPEKRLLFLRSYLALQERILKIRHFLLILCLF